LYRVLYSNFRALIILNFIDKVEIFIKGSNKDNILWKKNVAFALRLRIMIMKNKEIMRIWTCACMLNAWERERGEGNGNEGGYVLHFLCILALCMRTEAHGAWIWDRTFFAMDGGHVANCAASRFKIASQNQS